MRTVYHAADSRGSAGHDGLFSRRTFSFAEYHDPRRMGFGCLRVLNEEWLAPGKGIPLHAHENMEIVSIPISGTLRHEDSRGTRHVIPAGQIHVLSAGRGVAHWEHNHADDKPAHYLQLWIMPRGLDAPTHYGQGVVDPGHMLDRFLLAAAPASSPCPAPTQIDQDAYISMARLEPGKALSYEKYRAANGLYLFMIDGRIRTASGELAVGDGLGVHESDKLDIAALDSSSLICIEVPMTG